MEPHAGHLAGANRSRNSQSPSPSHSATASATSIHKRKLAYDDHVPPFPSSLSAETRDGALTSNDDLESISARGGVGDSDSDDESDAVVDDDEDDFNNDSSMRTFTAARLESSGAGVAVSASVTRTKPKVESSTVIVESSENGKDGVTVGGIGTAGPALAGGITLPGIVVKEDASKIFTENIQTSGAYSSREESLKREEEAGVLKFICLWNDGIDEHMVWLIGLKNIFSRQLPNMPKEYIVRLVMDRCHKSVMVIRRNLVVGGITYRPYVRYYKNEKSSSILVFEVGVAGKTRTLFMQLCQRFGEIAFCAITADEQVKGYGTRLMNHLKQHARDVDGLTHFLTYADNNAVGYFIKQGFTKEIHLEKDLWQGYIKEYDGVILMECKIDPKLPYTDLSSMIRRQRQAIDEKIRELSNCHIVYSGIDFQKKEAGIPKKSIKVEDIPGLREAGWTPDQWGHSRFKPSNSTDTAANQKHLTVFMRSLIKSMHDHVDAWPFKEPVDPRDVPDYYEIIKDPIDLKTMSKRVESEQYYITFEMFVADMKRMFSNARTYNASETIYYKCATRLESHFQSKVQSGLQPGAKIQP